MKKNDYKLVAVVICAALLLFTAVTLRENGSKNVIEVKVDGVVRGRYSLSENREIELNGTNHLVIQDGRADITDANCPDKVCVKQKPISKIGESLVCLPNKVIVTVVEGEENELDEVAN